MADEYIRKADAIKQCGFGMTSLHIADNLRKMRPADVVQVVRCRGCLHFDSDSHFCFLIKGYMQYDDFYSYGKRKGE